MMLSSRSNDRYIVAVEIVAVEIVVAVQIVAVEIVAVDRCIVAVEIEQPDGRILIRRDHH